MLDLVLLCCWSVGLGQGQELPVQTLCLQLLKRLTVERFVRCHQGKLRQQKHTHSGKKSALGSALSPPRCLPGVSVGNNTPSRGGNSCGFTQTSQDNAERFLSCCRSVLCSVEELIISVTPDPVAALGLHNKQ